MSELAGTRFGPYHLQHLLGRGGMSEVYLAYDERMERSVAIKVMAGSSGLYLERFRREAEAIDKLSHPHILPALDYDDQEPWHYLVMHYAPGGTLRDLLQEGPLTLQEAGIILSQVAGALHHAHLHGVLHRDIKPSNILLQNRHYTYLGDFGLAKMLSDGTDLTRSGLLMGTPEYMAPDLAEGAATARSDIYSLGVVLYQMVTGSVPFQAATSIATFWKHVREEPLPPSCLNPEVSASLDRVILRALEKDPAHRFSTAEALSEAYQEALNSQVAEEEFSVEPRSQHPITSPRLPTTPSKELRRAEVVESPSEAARRISSVAASLARERKFGRRIIPRRTSRSPRTPPTTHDMEVPDTQDPVQRDSSSSIPRRSFSLPPLVRRKRRAYQ